jgi:hypothetical protein
MLITNIRRVNNMRLRIYYTNGTIRTEKEDRVRDFYEFLDGVHIITPDSVYRDREGKNPPIVTFFQGLIAPLGSAQTINLLDRTWLNMDMTKDSGAAPTVSTSMSRSIAQFFGAVVPYMPFLIIGGILAYALLSGGV